MHPFDDPLVIAGQGTIGLEILEEMPEVEAIVVPVGGGGLIAGVAFTVKTLRPDIKVYGVQAAGAASMAESLAHDKREHLPGVKTIADGIAVKEPGTNTFDLCKRYVDKVVTVNDDEIAGAILSIIEKQKLVAEGAGAAAVAAAMYGKLPLEGKKVVCLVSGGNIDVNMLNRIINRGLAKNGRVCQLEIELLDKPGTLSAVLKIVGDQGGNILSVNHERITTATEINSCLLHLELETLNDGHIARIREAIADAGYKIVS